MRKVVKNIALRSVMGAFLVAVIVAFSPVSVSNLESPTANALNCGTYKVVWTQLAARSAPDRSSPIVFIKNNGQHVRDYGYGSHFGEGGKLYRYMTDVYVTGKVGWMIVDGMTYTGPC